MVNKKHIKIKKDSVIFLPELILRNSGGIYHWRLWSQYEGMLGH